MDIGYKLYELRKNSGLDAATFADMVGISKSYVHKLEKNQSVPTVSVLQRWVSCSKPDVNSESSKEKMDLWLELSLSFIFEEGFLEDNAANVSQDIAERELELAKVPKVITRLFPTHFLHNLYKKFINRG